jgi:hypothetical protein
MNVSQLYATLAIATGVAAIAVIVWRRRTKDTKAVLLRLTCSPIENPDQAMREVVHLIRQSSLVHPSEVVALLRPTEKSIALSEDYLQRIHIEANNSDAESIFGRLAEASSQLQDLERLRVTSFDQDLHCDLLKELWAIAFPGDDFKRKSPRWTEIGFQGNDPITDLRGGGVLALQQFLHFAKGHPSDFRGMVQFNASVQAEGGNCWYMPAVVSIQFTVQLTAQKYHCINRRHLATIYDRTPCNAIEGMQLLHDELLLLFRRHWEIDRPFIMEYNSYIEKIYALFFPPIDRQLCGDN